MTITPDGLPEAAVPSDLVAAVEEAVVVFGDATAAKLAHGIGEPEDQMRAPLEALLHAVAEAMGLSFTAVGETSLADLKVRPDYAAKVSGAITGYIEVKAPGKGSDPTRWKAGSHDRLQWDKLSALPNVLYTDGETWGLYRTGEPVGAMVRLAGDIRKRGTLRTDGDALARMLAAFLLWKPDPPRTINAMVAKVAPLTRLLRDEVLDTMAREGAEGGGPFTNLASDWRALLFPGATDFEFADGYAQSVTFALLAARTESILFEGRSVDGIARELGKTHSLLGKALSVLTDDTIGALAVTLDTLVRVISVVDFGRFAKHVADPYLAMYEHFLAVYDPELRKQTGSYYTPTSVVSAMTRLVDQVLRTRLGRPLGFAADDVTSVDASMGTGIFVLDVLETVAETVHQLEGPGAVAPRLTETATRLVGIEKQTGPFAVAEMRVSEALRRHGAAAPKGGVRLYVADTLEDPYAEETHLAATMEPIAVSRRRANQMKKSESVLVVLGNPPWRENAAGEGGFIEHGSPGTEAWATPLIDAFKEPGTSKYWKDLANLYSYFWRWATWKVFDAHPGASEGVVCFITPSGYLKGEGFAGMRRYLRERVSEGWVIDCTPEGLRPPVPTRIFEGVQQPLAIGIFVRRADNDPAVPATLHYQALSGLQAQKFEQLGNLTLDDAEWEDCPTEWTAPLLPSGSKVWRSSPAIGDLFPWYQTGVSPNRTWVYAPIPSTLTDRWKKLVSASGAEQRALFRVTNASAPDKAKPGLAGFPHSSAPVEAEKGACLTPVPVAYRSFDVQLIIPDDRLMHRPRPELWSVRSDEQTYITELHSQPLRPGGPALTFAAFTPDMDHFKGSAGGRVMPLYASADTSRPNLTPGLVEALAVRLGAPVSPEDVLAYVAAVTAHPAFSARFVEDLRTPGVRVPLTADLVVWSDAVALGRQVLWLHTRGQRFADPEHGRPAGAPKVTDPQRRPLVTIAIPTTSNSMPDELDYDPETELLAVGDGRIGPVSPAVVAYSVGGTNVLRKWFGYRRATRPTTTGEQSALDDMRPSTWPAAYTTDLLELLHVLTLVTDLEPAQAQLLDRVLAGDRVTVADLTDASVLPVPAAALTLPKIPKRPTSPEGYTQGTFD